LHWRSQESDDLSYKSRQLKRRFGPAQVIARVARARAVAEGEYDASKMAKRKTKVPS
jgi:hypothetical protein